MTAKDIIEGYTAYGCTIPPYMMDHLMGYVNHGHMPGGFLRAVLENNLMAAVARADSTNMHALPAYCVYLYNEVDSRAWGSPEAVTEWLAKFSKS